MVWGAGTVKGIHSMNHVPLKVGQPFNPFGMFNGIFIPEALVRYKGISAGAKLAFGRLARYAGQDGRCYPAVATLGYEIGVGDRQARNYLTELETAKLIRRVNRFESRGQTSNAIEFLWHQLFEQGVNDPSGEGVKDTSPRGRKHRSPKESQVEESHGEETDSDYLITNRKKRDSQSASTQPLSVCKQYPTLRELLARYMLTDGSEEKIYPTDRQVVDVMDAAAGTSEEEVLRCLEYLCNERGLRPGTHHGPRSFSWFPTVVGEYFRAKRQREQLAALGEPGRREPGSLSAQTFMEMTAAIEIEDSEWGASPDQLAPGWVR